MTTLLDKIIRENYLKQCLKEYSLSKDSYPSRKEYLNARKKEIAIHHKKWQKEDIKDY
jgi:hypothetical protein